MNGFPWKCPACGTVHTHPVNGCRHCNRAVEESDPIFSGHPDVEFSDMRNPGTVYQVYGPPKDGKVSVRVMKRREFSKDSCIVPFTFEAGFQESSYAKRS
jgi:hypothetical protein